MHYLQCRYNDAFVPFIWQLQLLPLGVVHYIAVLITAVHPGAKAGGHSELGALPSTCYAALGT